MTGRSVTLLTLVVLGLFHGSAAVGGEKRERPVILDAKVFVADSLIVGDLTSRGLFSDQIVGTVRSGLPAIVELVYRLVTRDNKTVNRGLHAYELSYDVWEDFFSVRGVDSTAQFSTFADMAGAIEHLRGVAIVPIRSLGIHNEYAIQFSIAVYPLRGRERQQIIGWVGDNVKGNPKGSWHEQVLNLNDLIQGFFARDGDSANRSDWYDTEFFRPRLLPGVDEEDR